MPSPSESALVGARSSGTSSARRFLNGSRDMIALGAVLIPINPCPWRAGTTGVGTGHTCSVRSAAKGCGGSMALSPYTSDGDGSSPHSLTPRRATWLVRRSPAQCTEEDRHLLARLTAPSPVLAAAVALAQDFASLVRRRQPIPSIRGWRALPRALSRPSGALPQDCVRITLLSRPR